MVVEWGPRGIRLGRHGSLRAGEGQAQGHTAELFISTGFLNGFSMGVRF